MNTTTIIQQNLELLNVLHAGVVRHLPPQFDREAVRSAGLEALVRFIDANPDPGAEFWRQRLNKTLRGRMLEEVHSQDVLSEHHRSKVMSGEEEFACIPVDKIDLSSEDKPDDIAADEDTKRGVLEAVKKLDDGTKSGRQMYAVIIAELEEVKQAETAKVLGITQQRVGQIERAAHKKLRLLLWKENDERLNK